MERQAEMQRIKALLRQMGETPVPTPEMAGFFAGKTVLITGGGGSIGGALCRRLAKCGIKKLVLFDMYENNAYLLEKELALIAPELPTAVEIGSVCDCKRIDETFCRHQPEIVCHAAAHKHVPLMESSPGEAIRNNIFGAKTVLDAAEKCSHFLLISTDKAVAPSSIMGCSKRLAELVVLGSRGNNRRTAVRFGNVLDSAGSILPLFRQQIALGGPVTITGKEMRRYFMSLPQAAGLVLSALIKSAGGDLFMLEMGEQLSIDLLARALIEGQGLVPDQDIAIRYLPPRPGEKLLEQLSEPDEDFQPIGEGLWRCGGLIGELDLEGMLSELQKIADMPAEKAAAALRQFTKEQSAAALGKKGE